MESICYLSTIPYKNTAQKQDFCTTLLVFFIYRGQKPAVMNPEQKSLPQQEQNNISSSSSNKAFSGDGMTHRKGTTQVRLKTIRMRCDEWMNEALTPSKDNALFSLFLNIILPSSWRDTSTEGSEWRSSD